MKNSIPQISIILPVYNREDKVARAIDSVLSQSYPDWELILINDNSTDTSLEVLKSYRDSRIEVLNTPKNVGPAAARNLGISKSRGNFVSFLDSDDCYEPDFLKLSFELLAPTRDEIGFAWTGYNYVTSTSQKAKFWKPSDTSNYYLSFLKALHTGTNSGLMVKREVFSKCGYFDDTLPAAEDTDFLLRIIQKFYFKTLSEPLVNIYIEHSDRLSFDFKKIGLAYNKIFPKHEPTINTNRILRQKWFYKMMWLNYHLGNYGLARGFFKKLIKDKYTHQRAWQIFLIFEVLGSKFGAKAHVFLSKKLE